MLMTFKVRRKYFDIMINRQNCKCKTDTYNIAILSSGLYQKNYEKYTYITYIYTLGFYLELLNYLVIIYFYALFLQNMYHKYYS